MNARGQAVEDRITPVAGGAEAIRRTLGYVEKLASLSEDEALAYLDSLSDEELADAMNITVHASKGITMFAKLFGLTAIQRFEYTPEDFQSALSEKQDLAVVREALREEEEHDHTTTPQGA